MKTFCYANACSHMHATLSRARRARHGRWPGPWLYDTQMICADVFQCLALCGGHAPRTVIGLTDLRCRRISSARDRAVRQARMIRRSGASVAKSVHRSSTAARVRDLQLRRLKKKLDLGASRSALRIKFKAERLRRATHRLNPQGVPRPCHRPQRAPSAADAFVLRRLLPSLADAPVVGQRLPRATTRDAVLSR
jgi:hypothetical protein